MSNSNFRSWRQMEEDLENHLKGKQLRFMVTMTCPQAYSVTPSDIKQVLDSELEDVVVTVERLPNNSELDDCKYCRNGLCENSHVLNIFCKSPCSNYVAWSIEALNGKGIPTISSALAVESNCTATKS